jgi:hypothetical protein
MKLPAVEGMGEEERVPVEGFPASEPTAFAGTNMTKTIATIAKRIHIRCSLLLTLSPKIAQIETIRLAVFQVLHLAPLP